MLSQEERELLIRTQETIHDATATAKIYGVSKRLFRHDCGLKSA